ncbi:hypothetical protein [Candidatus Lokiarchaeum ossiferum]
MSEPTNTSSSTTTTTTSSTNSSNTQSNPSNIPSKSPNFHGFSFPITFCCFLLIPIILLNRKRDPCSKI